jgi:cobalt-zinc-cadmium efflux system membrane fusion protein
LTGRILLNQNTTAQVKARFPGIVREVRKGQGESVKRDDILALIESNDSLQVYAVKSPLDGVILSRNTNVGDVAGEQPVFIIANLENVWAEFHIFPRDMARIRNGQTVNVSSFEGKAVGRAPIAVLSPVAESSSQTIVARVTLPNADKNLHSGMTVHGDVVIDSREAKVAVRSSAIQRMENKPVVFVRENDSYVMRPVRTGIADEQWTEILEGLSAGELYVSENSFLVKADIGKAGAAHED